MSHGTATAQTQPDRGHKEARGRQRTLFIVSLASLFGLSVWFSTNAIATALEAEKGLSEQDVAWLTIAVQLGFVSGAVAIALTNLADIMNARTLFFVSAIGAGAINLLVIPVDNVPVLFLVRFGTGAFLGGVYPPAMKVLAGWFVRGRGYALGMMVGALTLGSGSPHLLRSIFSDNWQAVVLGSSFLAFAGGIALRALVSDGPYDTAGAKFRPAAMLNMFSERGLRLALIGYLGHMWELYAMWAWIGAFMLYNIGTRPLFRDSIDIASGLTFGVFFVGAVACPLAGMLAERIGRTVVTSLAMVLSGSMALMIGYLPYELLPLILIAAMVWGATVIADSAQFSTAVTELATPEYRGTMLTFQMSLGFLLTTASIWLVPVVQDEGGWGPAFAMLAAGPIIGTVAMLWLRRLPEARQLAGGRG